MTTWDECQPAQSRLMLLLHLQQGRHRIAAQRLRGVRPRRGADPAARILQILIDRLLEGGVGGFGLRRLRYRLWMPRATGRRRMNGG
jgi:hypothetical protein